MIRKLRLRQKNGFLILKKKACIGYTHAGDDYPAFFRISLFSPRLLNKNVLNIKSVFLLWKKGFEVRVLIVSRTFENIVRNKCKYWHQYSNCDTIRLRVNKIKKVSSNAIMLRYSQKNSQESVYGRVLYSISAFYCFYFHILNTQSRYISECI